MDDEMQVVPTDGSQAQAESTQTTAAQVAPEPQTAPALSRDEVERLLNEREQKLRAEFEQQTRKMQSKTDKAYADALRKAKVIEESADVLGLDPEQVKAAKQNILDKEFAAAFSNADTQAQADAYSAYTQPTPPTDPNTVSRDELAQYLLAQGLDANAVDLSKYENVRRGDVQAEQDFLDDVAIARAKQAETRRQQKQQTAQAKQAAQVRDQFGKVAPAGAGVPSAGYDPEQRMKELLAKDPPSDNAGYNAYYSELDKLEAELLKLGKW